MRKFNDFLAERAPGFDRSDELRQAIKDLKSYLTHLEYSDIWHMRAEDEQYIDMAIKSIQQATTLVRKAGTRMAPGQTFV